MHRYQRQLKQQEEGLLPDTETLTLSPNRIKCHHPKCPKHNQNPANTIPDQMITVMVPLNASRTVQTTNNHDNHSGILSTDNSESLDTSKSSNKKYANIQEDKQNKTIRLRIPNAIETEQLIVGQIGDSATAEILNVGWVCFQNPCTSGFLSSPTTARRRSAVMFNEYVILHTPPANQHQTDKNIFSAEKMTQTSDNSIWQVSTKKSPK